MANILTVITDSETDDCR